MNKYIITNEVNTKLIKTNHAKEFVHSELVYCR